MADCDVLIVGGGPVGLITALGLARAGVNVTVIEAAAEISNSPRAMVYHWSVLAGLEKLGILEDALAAGFTKQEYTYAVFRTGEKITWSTADLADHTPYPFNLHLGQDRLGGIALAHLTRLPNATVLFNTPFQSLEQDVNGVTVTAGEGEERIRAKWVIGADGARSGVRRALGLDFAGHTWPERFVATNVYADFEALGYSRSNMLIDPRYGAIIAKIDNEGLWRVTYSEDESLPEDTVADRIPAFFKTILPAGVGYDLAQFSPYRMHQRAAETFRIGRVLLAGDAAHATNPTGGLGLTSGLFDAYVLYEALAAVIADQADESVLDRYAAARRAMFLDVVSPQATENKRLVFHSTDPARLDSDLDAFRRMATDKDYRLTRLLFPKKLETPSLV
jgi:3-(3-hydroxy-phenyl)propionate hydroxylase/6-hydroxy-3-succinoylpyridine 3-monooxygenase